jgi:hypothetical protein
MFMPELTLEIIWAILSIAVGAIAIAAWQFVVTLKKGANENEQWKWVSIFVNAAEQMMADGTGPERLDWVMAQIKARFPKLDTDTIRAMIEANVKNLR